MAYKCEQCGSEHRKLSQLLEHRRTSNHWPRFTCDVCAKSFGRQDNLNRHMKKHTTTTNQHCRECGQSFSREFTLNRHMEIKHQSGGGKKRYIDNENLDENVKRLRTDDDPRHLYTMTKIRETKMKKFRTTSTTYEVNFKELEVVDIPDILKTFRRVFDAIIEDMTARSKPNDRIRLTIESPSLDYPIIVPIGPVQGVNANSILSEIERVLQSNEDFVIDQGLVIEILHVDMPDGGTGKCRFIHVDRYLEEKKSVIRIQNNDELCCARAIVTAKARLDQHGKWNSIRQGCDIQRQMAEDLHQQAGVPIGRCGIEEVKQFQEHLVAYQLIVVSKNHLNGTNFNGMIYNGPQKEKKIYLYYNDEHYDVITSMAGFLEKKYYCVICQEGYNNKQNHKCIFTCRACKKQHECVENAWLKCDDCHIVFKSEMCYDLHKKLTKKGNSTCRKYYRCENCKVAINRKLHKRDHVCGEQRCELCKDYFPKGHKCYMLPEENLQFEGPVSIEEELVDEIENAKTFIFMDFECRQDQIIECDTGYQPNEKGTCNNCQKGKCGSSEHVPNLCVVHKVCTFCMDNQINEFSECENCGKNERVFKGPNTVTEFCQWLFSGENYEATLMCHNFQGYDSYPILQYLYKNAIVPNIVPNGAKIMSLTVPACKIKMIDSINFIPMALAKLPKMFNFTEMSKGYFPHLFNRVENQTVVMDHLPDVKCYNPDSMKPDDRKPFMDWYEQNKNIKFDFQSELLRYCRSDVDILRRCSLKFRDDFMDITGIDPFEKCITIASACQLVFRTNFLEPNTIGVIPAHGYNPEQVQSVKALQWIKYKEHTLGIRIQHARNGGEKEIGPYKADGYYETEDGEKVVLEFNGDFWHGNPAKYASSTVNPINKETMGALYDKATEKKKYLEDNGYTYVSIWESEHDKELKEDAGMRAFVDTLDIVKPLKPRDAFHGGRTEAFTLFKEATPDQEIKYYDVTSLYPFVNKTGKVPVGHPTIITEHFKDLSTYEGLIKCKVVPPRCLFIPVLPCKINDKLLFALCKTCAETQQKNPCQHCDDDRSFIGTWVSDEVKKAVEMGYKVIKIYEVWHFDQISQYDTSTKEGGVFSQYVNTFLKLKQEANGWPNWCETEDQKREYIRLYNEKEGVLLDYDKIEENKGMRALAKLMLNSFWGKFGQRSNMQQVQLVDDPAVYFDKLTSDQEEVTVVNFVSKDIVEMRWKYKEEFVDTNAKTNVIIAAYTTAQARLQLYSYLQNLGDRALYADTDSVVFSTQPGKWEPTLGDYLGDLTDEVPNNKIQTFVTGGPKNYGYKLEQADDKGNITHCKIRGITLNYKNLLHINYDVMETMVKNHSKNSVTVIDPFKICRERDNARLLTIKQTKDYRLVFDKRVIRENYVSYPYGF